MAATSLSSLVFCTFSLMSDYLMVESIIKPSAENNQAIPGTGTDFNQKRETG